ncbi:MAG TPA: iron ABC transporter permease [Xanthobacteraceae bacterium]|jgi:iron(III) transport system permease protein|nr:iron ABC transporter permease [Xanthobacteraceae bacterium]
MSRTAALLASSMRLPLPEARWLVIGAAVALAAWLALAPLGFLLWQSLFTPETATAPGEFTFDNYRTAYWSAETLRLLGNSAAFAAGSASLAFVVGTFFAWINERTDTPFKSAFFALSLVPLIIPAILFTVSWILLASPKIGIVNVAVQALFATDFVVADIYSMGGMIFVDGLHQSPLAFLMMTAAFRSMDPSLEEAALMCGAAAWQIALRMTLKLAWPAAAGVFLILFLRAIESFEVPALLGLPVGIEVYTSSIYQAVQTYPSDIGLASSYAAALLVIASLCVYAQSRTAVAAEKFSTVTGKGFRPRTMRIGRWRYVTALAFALYLAIVVVLPFLVLLWCSLQRFYVAPSVAALKDLTFDAYRAVFAYPVFANAVWNSLVLSAASATIVALTTAVLAWIVVRTRLPGRWLIDDLAMLPLMFPGLVLGLAIMVCYLNIGIGVYGTLWIMLIAYVTRFMPYGMRYNSTSMLALHKELEESATMSGASWSMTFWRVVLPLLKPGLIACWLYVVIVSIRELSSSILLYSPGSEVVSIMIWEYWQNGQYVELSALGVMLIASLLGLVLLERFASRQFGVASPGV